MTKETDPKNRTPAPTPFRVLYPPGMEWANMVQRPHHLLRLAGEAGWRIIWWENGVPRYPQEVARNVWRVHAVQDVKTRGPYDILYLTDPSQLGALRQAQPLEVRWVVYDRCDLRGAAEVSLTQLSDLVLAASPLLATEASYFARRVLYLPNAADTRHFSAGITRVPTGPPCIGYMGALSEHLDYALLERLIKSRPNYHWLFIGQEKGDVRLPALPNVERLGHVAYEDLPRVLQRVRVGILPFRFDPVTRATDPIKVYEYLAAGKHVVASRLPHLAAKDWPIRLARTVDEWLTQLDAAVNQDPCHTEGRRWVEAHTWHHRFTAFAAAVQTLAGRKESFSGWSSTPRRY